MNRNQRRLAKKANEGANRDLSASVQSIFADARRHYEARRLDDAERLYRKVLSVDSRHADSLRMLGVIASQAGRHDQAVDLIGKAIALDGRNAAYHFSMGNALRRLARPDEAMACFQKAIDLDPDSAEAHNNLGNAMKERGRLDEAVACFRKAIAIRPGYAEAHYNLGNAWQGQARLEEAAACYRRTLDIMPDCAEAHSNLGAVLRAQERPDEAIACFRKAIECRPGYVEAHNNLGTILREQDMVEEAIACFRRIIDVIPGSATAHSDLGNLLMEQGRLDAAAPLLCRAAALDPDDAVTWSRMAELLSRYCLGDPSPDVTRVLLGTLDHPATRAVDIAASAAATIRRDPAIRGLLTRFTGGEDLRHGAALSEVLAAMGANAVLLRLLETACIPDVALERLLTTVRAGLLDVGDAALLPAGAIAVAAALAAQCFINEYAYIQAEEEESKVADLAEAMTCRLAQGQPIAPLDLVTLACYRPLWRLERAENILARQWPETLATLIRLQVCEPLEETRLRATIPALTPISDGISQAVRAQYEDNPYPRWIHGVATAKPMSLEQCRVSLKAGPAVGPVPARPEILVAGCGTGRHSIECATRYAGARVLAVDLSLSSLAYAKRKTAELGLANIDYQQGDIMELCNVARRFDVIECSGVLHHMADPIAGWRTLVDLLKPGGLMLIGLYSQLARRHVVAARAHIAARGYGCGAADIRRCRADIMALPADAPLATVATMRNFFSLSECRDLLFHIQEHRFTLPEIETCLAQLGMEFLGFSNSGVSERYRARFPDEPTRRSLANWQLLETESPDIFFGMYQFWVYKRA